MKPPVLRHNRPIPTQSIINQLRLSPQIIEFEHEPSIISLFTAHQRGCSSVLLHPAVDGVALLRVVGEVDADCVGDYEAVVVGFAG